MELLLATHNTHKLLEIRTMLSGSSIKVRSLQDIGYLEEIAETGATFRENAIIKARTVAMEMRGLTLADDSGLEVDYLGGKPGVYSARYAGGDTSSGALCAKLLQEMSAANDTRTAHFVTVMAVADSSGTIAGVFEGRVSGEISRQMTGEQGFGYDPVFYYPPFRKTMAQMTPDEKNSCSHRFLALEQVVAFLREYDGRL